MARPFFSFSLLHRFSLGGALYVVLSIPPAAFAQKTGSTPSSPDTTATTQIRSIPNIGAWEDQADSSSLLHSSQFVRSDAFWIGSLLSPLPFFFLRELGQPGQPHQLLVRGVDRRGLSLSIDGRPLVEPIFGVVSLNDIPLEYVDWIETPDGTTLTLPSPGLSGGSINFVTRQFSTVRPVTKVRYLQGPFDHLLSDGFYTQNISRTVNVMAGFQRNVTDGRFTNSSYDAWNLRWRVRYNPSNRLNLVLSDLYNSAITGLNGGVRFDLSPSIYDEVTARVKTPNASQSTSRRDLTLSGIARLFPDSSSVSIFHLYYSSADREFEDRGETGFRSPFFDEQHSSIWGIKGDQRLHLPFGMFAGVLVYERRSAERSLSMADRSEGYLLLGGNLSLNLSSRFTPGVWAKLQNQRSESHSSLGISLKVALSSSITLFAGILRDFRFPAMQEAFWNDSTIVRTDPLRGESHRLIEAGLTYRVREILGVSLTGYERSITDPILFEPLASTRLFPNVHIRNAPTTDIRGLALYADISVGAFRLFSSTTWTDIAQGDSTKLVIPRWRTVQELSFRHLFFRDALDATLAIRLRGMSRQHGLSFVPQSQMFVEQNDLLIGGFTVLDAFAALKFGDAYVSVIWENVLDGKYLMAPVYPMLGRNLKIGVNWKFLD